MKRFLSIIDNTNERAGKICSYLLLMATLVVITEVILRYVFNNPTIYSLQLTTFLCAATYLVAGGYAYRLGTHIKVDILYSHLTPRVRAIIDLLLAPLFFFSMGVVVWAGSKWTIAAIIAGTRTGEVWGPLIWPVRLLIPLGFLLVLLQGVAKYIRDIRIARTGEAEAGEEVGIEGVGE